MTHQSEGVLLGVVLSDEREHEVIVALHGRQVERCQARHGACVDEGFVGQQGIAHLRVERDGMKYCIVLFCVCEDQ